MAARLGPGVLMALVCSGCGSARVAPEVGARSQAEGSPPQSRIADSFNAAIASFDSGDCGTNGARVRASLTELSTTPAIPPPQSGETLFCATYNPKHARSVFVLQNHHTAGAGWAKALPMAPILPGDENFVVVGDQTSSTNDELGNAYTRPPVSGLHSYQPGSRWRDSGTSTKTDGGARFTEDGKLRRELSWVHLGEKETLVTHAVKGDAIVRDDPDDSQSGRSYAILLGGVLPQWLKVSRLLARKLWKRKLGAEPGATDGPLEDILAKMIFMSMWGDRIEWVECDRLVKKCVQENGCIGYDRYFSILDSASNKFTPSDATSQRMRDSFGIHDGLVSYDDVTGVPSSWFLKLPGNKSRFDLITRQEFFAADLLQTNVWNNDNVEDLRTRLNYVPPKDLGLAAPNTDDNIRNQLGRWRQGWSALDVMYAWGTRAEGGVSIRPTSWDWNHLFHIDLSQKPTVPYPNSNTQHDAVSSTDALGGGALKCVYRVNIAGGRPTGVLRGAIRGQFPSDQAGNLAQWQANTAVTTPDAQRCQDVLPGQTVTAADWQAPTGLTGANPNASARPCVGMVMRNSRDFVDANGGGSSANILLRQVYYLNRWSQKFKGSSSWLTGLLMTGGMFIFAAATPWDLPFVALAAWGFALHSTWTTGVEIWNELSAPPDPQTPAPNQTLSWGNAGSASDSVAMAPAATVCNMPDDQVLEIARADAERNGEMVDCDGSRKYAKNIVRKDVEVVGSVARTSMSAVSELFLRGEVQVRTINRSVNNLDELSDFAVGDIVSGPNDSFRWCVMRSPISFPIPPARQEGSGGTGTAELLFKSTAEEQCRSENFLEVDSLRQGNGDSPPDPDHYTLNYIRSKLNARQFFPHWNAHIGLVVPLPMYGTAASHGDPQTQEQQNAEGWLPARKLFSRWPGNFKRPDAPDSPPHNRGSLGVSRMAKIPLTQFPGLTVDAADRKFVYITPLRRASATDIDPRMPWGTCVRTNERWDDAAANVVVRTYSPNVSSAHPYDIGDIYFKRPAAFNAAADDTRLQRAQLQISWAANGQNKNPKIKIYLPADLNNNAPGTQALKLEGALRVEGQYQRRQVDGAWQNRPGAPRGFSLSVRGQAVYYLPARTEQVQGVTYNYSENQLGGIPTTVTQGGTAFDTFSGYLWGYIDLVTIDGKKVDRYWVKSGLATNISDTLTIQGVRYFKHP